MAEFKDVRYDTRVRKQAYSLAKAGFCVHLIMFNSSLKKKRIKKEKNIVYHELSFPHHNKMRSFQDRLKRKLYGVMKILYINWYIISHQADIYHAHNLKFLFSCVISASLHSGKVVYDAHELHSEKFPPNKIKNRLLNKFNYFYEKIMLNYIDLFIQASHERMNYVANLYKIHRPLVIENHTNLTTLQERTYFLHKRLGLLNNDFLLVYVGGIRLGGSRKLERIIESLNFLNDNIHFVLIGPSTDSDKKNITYFSKQYKVENRVHILDPLPHQEIVFAISSADLSVIPLYANCLNIQMSALNKISESCMAGLPIVSSNYKNLERIINHNPVGKIGHTFDINSVGSIVLAINHCLIPENKEKYKKNALKLAKKYYNWENEEKKLIKAYNELIFKKDIS